MKTETETPQYIQDFNRLVEIVSHHFRVEPDKVVSRMRGHKYTTARHVVAALFSNWETLQGTADLLFYKSHQSVYLARKKVQEMIETGENFRMLSPVIDEVSEELPHLLP